MVRNVNQVWISSWVWIYFILFHFIWYVVSDCGDGLMGRGQEEEKEKKEKKEK